MPSSWLRCACNLRTLSWICPTSASRDALSAPAIADAVRDSWGNAAEHTGTHRAWLLAIACCGGWRKVLQTPTDTADPCDAPPHGLENAKHDTQQHDHCDRER